MKLFRLFLFAAVATACAGSSPTPAPAPATAPGAEILRAPDAPTVAAVTLDEAPKNWHLLDETADHIPGISLDRAMKELLAGKQPKRTVVVAIIDGGIDTAHMDLKANLWTNPKETPGNKKDDDANGYVDDVRGWNFIGGADGKDVWHDTFEVTRELVQCTGGSTGPKPFLSAPEQDRCNMIAADYEQQKAENAEQIKNYHEYRDALSSAIPVLKARLGTDSLTLAKVRAILPDRPELEQARRVYVGLVSQGASLPALDEAIKDLESRRDYALNPAYNPRSIVGDNYADVTERRYGNADVTGPDAKHGTHVAGIIGAVRDNGVGIDGIAPAVRLMGVRAVPDGDERDKDIANAIRYAADNGAQIISMSFGKGYSPQKAAVDDAVRYADAKGVLMVHAAGNDGADLGHKKNFPSPVYLDGTRPKNWIEVGASSWKGGQQLAASFSNYSKDWVDVFAPGVDIYSSVPGNKYEQDSGTSMAAPVVSGLAALIMDYYPNLTAADVKRVILGSVMRPGGQMVQAPGSGGMPRGPVSFSTLSATGGIVNAYNAIKLAEQMSGARP
jgi:subtilisin family serine protease